MEIRHSHRQELAQGSPEEEGAEGPGGREVKGPGGAGRTGSRKKREWRGREWGERGERERPKEGMWLWECTSSAQASRLLLCDDDIWLLGEAALG